MRKIQNLTLGVLAAGCAVAPAEAVTTQTFNFANDGSGVRPVTLGANPAPQFRYRSEFDGSNNKASFEAEPSFALGNVTGYVAEPPMPFTGSVLPNTSVQVLQKGGNRYVPLKFQINGAKQVGNAFFDDGGNFEKVSHAAAVPEPATWMELLAGFALAGAAVRRRRQSAAA